MPLFGNLLHNKNQRVCTSKLRDTIFSGPEDPGPGTRGPMDTDPNWHTLYVYIHSTYIVHVPLITRLECTMEQTKCTVDDTFVLAAFVPFHSEQMVSTELIKYARDL